MTTLSKILKDVEIGSLVSISYATLEDLFIPIYLDDFLDENKNLFSIRNIKLITRKSVLIFLGGKLLENKIDYMTYFLSELDVVEIICLEHEDKWNVILHKNVIN